MNGEETGPGATDEVESYGTAGGPGESRQYWLGVIKSTLLGFGSFPVRTFPRLIVCPATIPATRSPCQHSTQEKEDVMKPARKKFTRRALLELAPAVTALIVSRAGSTASAMAQSGEPPAPMRVTKDQVKAALDLLGLDFTGPQRDMMMQNVSNALVDQEALRRISVPLDTEPAFHFSPAQPGKDPKPRPSRFLPTRVTRLVSFSDVEELAFLPVTELAPLVRAKKVTSTALTKMYLARLKKYSPKLLNVITLTEDLALEQAARADEEIRAGRYRGHLHGIPYGVKDLINTKGIKTTWGAEPFMDQVPTYNATVIDRLENAGAVLVAKLSMGALARGERWFGGQTKNPWNIEEGSGGSSAGPASATAAGLVGFSIGSETFGSILGPSSRCGVTGIRPTYGRVSRYGVMTLSWTLDKVGPLCRSAEDCAIVLKFIQGPDGHDVTVIDAPFDWEPAAPISDLNIGYVRDEFDNVSGQKAAELKKVYADALDALRKAGAKLEPVDLPATPARHLRTIIEIPEAAAAFDDITRDGAVDKLSGQAPGDWPNTFRSARLIPAVEYIRGMRIRALLQRTMAEFMEKWDVIVTPASSVTVQIGNLTGCPQVAQPCGHLNGNSSQSIYFFGRPYEEGLPLRVARAFEVATQWRSMHPKMDWT
jgi:Asp-tRNA(Asn)/Glu-tRNA(Gln) amidotransferase A subunit family amidase